MGPIVLGASAYNDHVQQMARALAEADRLALYVTGAVDVWHGWGWSQLRKGLARSPRVDRMLARRAVTQVPPELVHPIWGWDVVRTVASAAKLGAGLEDWCWERAERTLDGYTARLIDRPTTGGYLGVEFGALHSLRAARALGKPGILAFLSAHHATRRRWLDPELARFAPERSATDRRLDALSRTRDQRRDDEAAEASLIVTGSSFTTRSLVDAGVPAERVVTVPLGGPTPLRPSDLPAHPPATLDVMYAGPLAIHKGVHYLIDAWRRLSPTGARLHLFGQMQLPDIVARRAQAEPSITLHGSVPASELRQAYRRASVLVLPTLGDGFGQVVADALAHGLPVVTTTNAGAADRIVSGENGFVLPAADIDALTARLDWCLRHPDDLFSMRPSALAHAARWTWTEFRQAFVAGLDAHRQAEPVFPRARTA